MLYPALFISFLTIIFFFFQVQPVAAHPQIPSTGNLAKGVIVRVSSMKTDKSYSRYVLDGNDETKWESSAKNGQWLRIDFTKVQPVGKLAILWEADTTKNYKVQVSDDNVGYTTVAEGTTNGEKTQLITHTLNFDKRYMRILAVDRHGIDRVNAIREIGVYARQNVSPTPSVSTSGFVTVCGTQLCFNGKPFVIHSATMYGQYDNPDAQLDLALKAGLNTVELVEYEKNYRDMNSVMAEDTWKRNDRFIAKAKEKGLKVILHFSSYGHALAKAGKKPTTTDWNPFLTFVMNRKNTITGVKYAEDPTIAKIQLYGEIDAPNYNVEPNRGTTAETTAFFKRTLAQLRVLDKKHVISTGGFSYINDPNSGIDWKAIVSDPNNQVCDVEINSFGDRNVSMPNVSGFCKNLGKPWFLSAWSSCQGTAHFSDDSNHWPTDSEMATHAEDMYKVARNQAPKSPGPAIASVGTSFWNLGNTAARVNNCDIGNQYPLTFETVKKYTP